MAQAQQVQGSLARPSPPPGPANQHEVRLFGSEFGRAMPLIQLEKSYVHQLG